MTVSPTAATVPDTPTSVNATAGIKSARVSWTAPSDGGSPIANYTVTPITGGVVCPPTTVTGSPPAISVEVAGLDNASSYIFTVTATNEVGTGSASTSSNAVAPGPPAVPGRPPKVYATPGNKSARVSWTAPSDGGSRITKYTVTSSTGGNARPMATVEGSPPATSAKVAGLNNASSYTFTVTATNAAGTGPASNLSDVVVPAPEAPGRPPKVYATPGNKSARVSWTAPSDGGSRITKYTVTSSTGGNARPMATVEGSPPGTRKKVPSLDNASSYTFTVTATNAVGEGPASAASDETIPGLWRHRVRQRHDDKRPIRGWLAVVLLAAAAGVEVWHASGRWGESPPSHDYGWAVTVVLLAVALIFAVLWAPAGFSARGRTVPAKPVRRRGALRRTVIVEGVVAVVLVVIWAYAVSGPAHHTFMWFAGRRNFVWTPAWSALAAAFFVTDGLLFAHGFSRLYSTAQHPADFEPDPNKPEQEDEQRRENAIAFRTSGLKGAVVGADGLASTSRLMPALWTVALLFAVVLLLLVGRTPHCPNPLPPGFGNPAGVSGSCPAGALAIGGGRFTDQLGKNFPWDYLLLLGFPVGAALAAKWQAITYGAKLRAPTIGAASKPSTPDPQDIGVKAGLSQVISNDAGQGSLVNAQYLAFTLVTIGYFLLQVVTHSRNGLPVIPTALLVLSGVAVGGYVANRHIVGHTTPQGSSAGSGGQ